MSRRGAELTRLAGQPFGHRPFRFGTLIRQQIAQLTRRKAGEADLTARQDGLLPLASNLVDRAALAATEDIAHASSMAAAEAGTIDRTGFPQLRRAYPRCSAAKPKQAATSQLEL